MKRFIIPYDKRSNVTGFTLSIREKYVCKDTPYAKAPITLVSSSGSLTNKMHKLLNYYLSYKCFENTYSFSHIKYKKEDGEERETSDLIITVE